MNEKSKSPCPSTHPNMYPPSLTRSQNEQTKEHLTLRTSPFDCSCFSPPKSMANIIPLPLPHPFPPLLSLQGPAGVKGRCGMDKPSGIPGRRGPAGLPGIAGIRGIIGKIGIPGRAGKQGTRGLDGIRGLLVSDNLRGLGEHVGEWLGTWEVEKTACVCSVKNG